MSSKGLQGYFRAGRGSFSGGMNLDGGVTECGKCAYGD